MERGRAGERQDERNEGEVGHRNLG
jgi:hypothetical protein